MDEIVFTNRPKYGYYPIELLRTKRKRTTIRSEPLNLGVYRVSNTDLVVEIERVKEINPYTDLTDEIALDDIGTDSKEILVAVLKSFRRGHRLPSKMYLHGLLVGIA